MDWDLQTVDDVLLETELSGYEECIVDGLISSTVTTIAGDTCAGKTHLAIDAARSLLTGAPFLGRSVARTLDRVAFLCGEPGGRLSVARRSKAAGVDGRRLVVMSFYMPESRQDCKDAVSVFRRDRIGAVIVDGITTGIPGGIRDPRDVKMVLDGLRLWSDNGAAILSLHHDSQMGGCFESALWRKWTRIELKLSGSPGSSRCRLQSVGGDAEPVNFSLVFDPAEAPAFKFAGERVRPERPDTTAGRNAEIAAYVTAGHSWRDAERHFGVSHGKVSRAMEAMRRVA